MDKSLVTSNPIVVPKELEKFLSKPLLIGTDTLEDFKTFFSVIATAAKPVDDVGLFLVWDLAVLWWDIRNERFIRAEIIKATQQSVANGIGLTRADFERERRREEKMLSAPSDEDDQPSMFRKRGSEPTVKKQNEGFASVAMAYLQHGEKIEAADLRIAALEYRRNNQLREVERWNQNMTRRGDKAASDFVDAEFTNLEH